MDWVNIAFIGLQIVALVVNLRHKPLVVRHLKELVLGQQRRLAGPDISQDEAADLLAGKSWLANLMTVLPFIRLTRLLQDISIHIVEPTMIDAAQTAVFKTPIAQIRAAVAAMRLQSTDPALFVTKNNQLLAHQSH